MLTHIKPDLTNDGIITLTFAYSFGIMASEYWVIST